MRDFSRVRFCFPASLRGAAGRGVSAAVAVAFLSASLGTTSLAFAQAKTPAKPAGTAAPAAKAPAPPPAKPAKGEDKKEAGKHFKKGKELFEKKEWKAAKAEFMQAEEILPAAQAEFYIARCADESGEGADAASWYQKSIDSGKLSQDQAGEAKTHLDALKKKPAKLKITSDPPGASISIDGKPISDKTPAEVELTPGSHKVSVTTSGKKPAEQDVDVVAFTGASVNVKLEAGAVEAADDPFKNKPVETTPVVTDTPPPTTAVTTDTAPTKRDMTWVYVTGGAAIVALGVGTIFGLKALGNHSDYEKTPTRDTRDAGTRNALISDMGFGIGITLAVTSAVLYFTSPAKESAAKPSTMAFAPFISVPTTKGAPSMAGAAASFAF